MTPVSLILGTLETAATQRGEITITEDDLTVSLTHVSANVICGQIRHNTTGEEYKTYIHALSDTDYSACCQCYDSTVRRLICEHAIALAIYAFRKKHPATTLSA
jgi:hypothetical protein